MIEGIMPSTLNIKAPLGKGTSSTPLINNQVRETQIPEKHKRYNRCLKTYL